MGVSVTRVVKFIRKGDKGDRGDRGSSVIYADTATRMLTEEQWKSIGTPGKTSDWVAIMNADSMRAGDVMIVSGEVTDKESISAVYYGTVVNTGLNKVAATAIAVIMSGQRGLQGIQGPRGEQGIPGVGTDGKTTYFHIRYSAVPSPTASQMTETPSTYIGTYVDFTEQDSQDPSAYTWYRFQGLQGEQGEQGIPGVGTDGKTTYLHIKYSNDGGKTFTGNGGEDVGDYIGVCTDFTEADPTSVSVYTWSKIKGDKGDKGDRGDRGAVLRGPQDWEEVAAGYMFQSGGSGEYKDVVIYGGQYYSCTMEHVKTSTNYPGSDRDTEIGLWKLADKVEIIATNILLAQYSLIKNLGVETIDMKDSAGNIIFQAKGGEVTCNKGTFKGVDVQGDITADSISLKVNTSDRSSAIDGSLLFLAGTYVMPRLEAGVYRSVKLFIPTLTRTVASVTLRGIDANVLIAPDGDILNARQTVTFSSTGMFELIGMVYNSKTYWSIFRMPDSMSSIIQ